MKRNCCCCCTNLYVSFITQKMCFGTKEYKRGTWVYIGDDVQGMRLVVVAVFCEGNTYIHCVTKERVRVKKRKRRKKVIN